MTGSGLQEGQEAAAAPGVAKATAGRGRARRAPAAHKPPAGAMSAQVDLAPFVNDAYLAYSMKVVRDRAIPDVEDGLKPVQRRILYAMRELGLNPKAKPMKSARVVGDVIGKYHPHGDSAVYEAMVRMAQPFSLRYPLVAGEGNFGTRDGDSPAAMRYTEARLTPLAMAALDEIDSGTVDMAPNFDGTLLEPQLLPARLPLLLLNGSSGIAVGFATEFAPHNLREVAAAAALLIEKPDASLDEVLALMPAPDFPTGAALVSSPQELRKVYEEGQGSLRLRARWRTEGDAKHWRLVFYELPQGASAETILMEIRERIEPTQREKGGRRQPLTPEQQRLKRLFGDLVADYQNHADRTDPVRLVITPRDRRMNPADLAAALLAHTGLERSVPVNLVALDTAGSPRPGTVVDWLGQWCSYRISTVRRRTLFEKQRIDARLHVLAGRLSILDRIEEVVRVLSRSSDPQKDLMEVFGLDAIQAADIMDMRLRQVTNLEKTRILADQASLRTEQQRLERLLGSDRAMKKQVLAELAADAKTFGDDRRTVLEPLPPDVAGPRSRKSAASAVSVRLAPEPVAVALTERGWIAWRPARSMEEAVVADFKIKSGDAIHRIFFGDRNDHLLLLDAAGKGYSIHLHELPSRADTAPLTTWIEPAAAVIEGAIAAPDDRFLLAGRSGYGFIVRASDWIGRLRAGKAMLTMASADDRPLPPHPLANLPPEATVWALSSDGRAVAFPLADVKALPRGKGVGLQGLSLGAALADVAVLLPGQLPGLRTAQGLLPPMDAKVCAAAVGRRSAAKKGVRLYRGTEAVCLDRPGNPPLPSPQASVAEQA